MDNTKAIQREEHSTPSVSKGKNYILAIGIDDYSHHRSLDNAVADAKAFATVMTNRYGFEHLHEPLYNKEATQHKIRKAIGKCETLGEHDRLVVFYSGHGWYKTAAKLGYLVPTEAEDDPNSDFIPVDFITNIFRAVKAQHILLVVDCCFGGSFGLERDVTVAMTDKKISKLDTKKSRMVLSSGGIELVSDGFIAGDNSPFSKPLIAILSENQAPQLAFSEFFNQLCKKTLWNADQLPQYKVLYSLGHEDGELALYCTDLESPEERDYKKAVETNSIPLLERFIKDFHQSEHKATIRTLLKEKRASVAWDKIKNSRHIEVFDEFLDNFPDSSFAVLARQKMSDIEIAEDDIENQKRIAAETARKEKDRLAQLEIARKKQEADDNAQKEKDRLAQLDIERKEQEADDATRKENERLAQLESACKKQEADDADRKKEDRLEQLEIERKIKMPIKRISNVYRKPVLVIDKEVKIKLSEIISGIQQVQNNKLGELVSSVIQQKSDILEGEKSFKLKDYERAFELLYKYSKNNSLDSTLHNKLGIFFHNGDGVKKDSLKAIKCFQKAATLGNKTAYYNLGMMYENAFGTIKNEQEAFKNYLKADYLDFKKEFPKAKAALDKLSERNPNLAGLINQKDDLRKIEGIGLQIEELLNKSGILTYSVLSVAPIKEIQKILNEAGLYDIKHYETWNEQAKMADEDKWKELKDYHFKLLGRMDFMDLLL